MMKYFSIQAISFMALILLIQSIILPWVISNDRLPLWVDIVLVVSIFATVVMIVERIIINLIKIVKEDKNINY